MRKILVVEDDDDLRQTLKDILEKNEYEVDVAEDGIAALNRLWTNSYDMALTDVVMPGINGLELMKTARRIQPLLDFFVITGNGSENEEEAIRLGAKAFIKKPFTANELLLALRVGRTGHTECY